MIVSPGTCFARSLTRSAKFNLYIIQRNKYNYTKQTDEEREIADSGRFKFFGSAIIERLPSLKPPVGQWYEDWFNTHVETFEKYNRNWTFEELAAGMADPSKAVANSSTQAKKKAKKKDAGPTTMNEDKLRKIYGLPKEDDEEQASQEPVAEKPLEFYPRETVFDKNDDRRALYRCLDRSIYLLVRKKRKEDPWQFPLAVWNENETMRETVERAITEEVGSKFRFYVVGNAPEGHWVQHFNEEQKQMSGYDGYKIFYYRVLMLGGSIEFSSAKTLDFAWADKNQLKEYYPTDHYKLFHHMLDNLRYY